MLKNKFLNIMFLSFVIALSLYSKPITLQSGWNLLGTGQDLTLSDINKSCIDIVWTYKSGQWSAFSPKNELQNKIDANTNISSLDAITTDSGFWAEANSACILDLPQSSKKLIAFHNKWNLLGTGQDLTLNDINKSCIGIVWTYKNGQWSAFSPKNELQNKIDANSNISSLTSIAANSGFWVEANILKNFVITENNVTAKVENIGITFSPYDIDKNKTLTIAQTSPQTLGSEAIDSGYKVKSYDFTLNGKTDFTDLVEITLPYDNSFIQTTGDKSGNIFAMYYNPISGKYEPVDYTVDTTKKEVKILTNHLSDYALFITANGERHGAFKIINNNSRKAYITATDAYYKFFDSDTAVSIINDAISNNMTPTDQANEAGFNKANEWLGIVAAGNTLASSPFSNNFLTSLGNSFNAVGAGASILQAGFDFANGDIVSLYSNLSKNVVYNAVNYFGTSALQLAFVGVFAIDYSLSAFANEAWDGNNKKWHATYEHCYNKHFEKRPKEWYKTFYWIWHDAKDFGEAKEKIDKAINDNVFAVWNKLTPSDRAECMDDLGYTNLGGDNTSLETNLALAKKSELVAGLLPVFDRLEKRIMWDLRAKYKTKLEEVRNTLNQKINVQIKTSYAGYKFRFSPLNDRAKKAEWTGTLNSSGAASGAWRVLGYMQAGSPNKLELFKPTDNPDTATPVKTVEFTITPPNLVINIGSSNDTNSTVAYDSCPLISDGSTYIFVDKTNHKMYYNPDSANEYLQSKEPKNYFTCTYSDFYTNTGKYQLYYTSYYEDGVNVLNQEWYPSGNADGLGQHVKYNTDLKNNTWQHYTIEEVKVDGLVTGFKYVLTGHGTL